MLLAFKVVWSGDGWLELVFLDTALDSSAPERLNYTRPPLDHGVPLKSPIITLFQIIPWSCLFCPFGLFLMTFFDEVKRDKKS